MAKDPQIYRPLWLHSPPSAATTSVDVNPLRRRLAS